MSDRDLHGLAGRLVRDFQGAGLSDAQDWLLTAALSELEWRRRRKMRRGDVLAACHCWLCFSHEYAVEPGV